MDGVAALKSDGFGVELFLDMCETFSHVVYGAVFIDVGSDADASKLWVRIDELIDDHDGMVCQWGPIGPNETLRDLWADLPPAVKRQ
jgi:hypothetical protein